MKYCLVQVNGGGSDANWLRIDGNECVVGMGYQPFLGGVLFAVDVQPRYED